MKGEAWVGVRRNDLYVESAPSFHITTLENSRLKGFSICAAYLLLEWSQVHTTADSLQDIQGKTPKGCKHPGLGGLAAFRDSA